MPCNHYSLTKRATTAFQKNFFGTDIMRDETKRCLNKNLNSMTACTQWTVYLSSNFNFNSCSERLCEGIGKTLRKDDCCDMCTLYIVLQGIGSPDRDVKIRFIERNWARTGEENMYNIVFILWRRKKINYFCIMLITVEKYLYNFMLCYVMLNTVEKYLYNLMLCYQTTQLTTTF